jgi:thiol-disulfide isomerase/thioredoxin
MSRTTAVTLAIVVIALLAGACGGGAKGTDVTMNAYTGQAFVGNQFTLDSVLEKKKPLVLNFFAGNCSPCEAEIPGIERLWKDQQASVTVVGIDIGEFRNLGAEASARSLIERLLVTYPTARAPSGSFVDDWKVVTVPKTFFVKPNGDIFAEWEGAISPSRLSEQVRGLIAASR